MTAFAVSLPLLETNCECFIIAILIYKYVDASSFFCKNLFTICNGVRQGASYHLYYLSYVKKFLLYYLESVLDTIIILLSLYLFIQHLLSGLYPNKHALMRYLINIYTQ